MNRQCCAGPNSSENCEETHDTKPLASSCQPVTLEDKNMDTHGSLFLLGCLVSGLRLPLAGSATNAMRVPCWLLVRVGGLLVRAGD